MFLLLLSIINTCKSYYLIIQEKYGIGKFALCCAQVMKQRVTVLQQLTAVFAISKNQFEIAPFL